MIDRTNLAIASIAVVSIVIMVLAIAYQDFSLWVFPFSILFGCLFFGVLWLCYLNFREDRFAAKAKHAYPNQPWLWDARWQSNEIPPRSVGDFWGSIILTTILSMFALFGATGIILEVPKGNYWALLGILPIIFAGTIGKNTYLSWKSMRYARNVKLVLETIPVWTGSQLNAKMHFIPNALPDGVTARLEHFQTVREVESDGDVLHKTTDLILNAACDFKPDNGVTISVDLPADCQETTWDKADLSGWWELVITISTTRESVDLRYEVPVADSNRR